MKDESHMLSDDSIGDLLARLADQFSMGSLIHADDVRIEITRIDHATTRSKVRIRIWGEQ